MGSMYRFADRGQPATRRLMSPDRRALIEYRQLIAPLIQFAVDGRAHLVEGIGSASVELRDPRAMLARSGQIASRAEAEFRDLRDSIRQIDASFNALPVHEALLAWLSGMIRGCQLITDAAVHQDVESLINGSRQILDASIHARQFNDLFARATASAASPTARAA